MLGNIIAQLHDDAFVQESVAGLGDLVLLARLRQAAEAAGTSVGEAATDAVGRFVQHAGDEQWLALVTAASRAPDPAAACLHRMLLDALPGNGEASSADASHEHEPH
jgi:hypothetical protein